MRHTEIRGRGDEEQPPSPPHLTSSSTSPYISDINPSSTNFTSRHLPTYDFIYCVCIQNTTTTFTLCLLPLAENTSPHQKKSSDSNPRTPFPFPPTRQKSSEPGGSYENQPTEMRSWFYSPTARENENIPCYAFLHSPLAPTRLRCRGLDSIRNRVSLSGRKPVVVPLGQARAPEGRFLVWNERSLFR